MKIWPVLAALALVLLAAVAPAAGEGGVRLTVSPGYQGYYVRSTYPTPVRVTVSNSGPSFRATVEVSAPIQGTLGRYHQEIDLPRNSTKALTFYPAFTGFASALTVTVSNGGRAVARQQASLSEAPQDGRMWGIVSSDPDFYAALNDRSATPPRTAVRLTPETLPERADALLNLSAIVMDGVPSSELSSEQVAALRSWVSLGGTLIVAGGADARDNASGLGSLLPVSLSGQGRSRDISAVADLLGRSDAPGRGVVALAGPAPGAMVLAGSPSQPLIARRATGSGAVVWLAWSPSARPFRDWRGEVPLLQSLATTSPPKDTPQPQSWDVAQFLQQVAGLSLPSTFLVAGFLLLYVLVVGPGVYLVLKRRDRRELAWVLVPALILVFSALAYGGNFVIGRAGTVLRTLDVVSIPPAGGPPVVTTYASLFSPGRTSYDISFPADYTLLGQPGSFEPFPSGASSGTYDVRTGDPNVWSNVRVDVYSTRTFVAQHVEPEAVPRLAIRLDSLSGSVRNESGQTFSHVYVLKQGQYASLGRLAPGQRADITAVRGWNGGPGGTEEARRLQMLNGLMFRNGPMSGDEITVVAWQEGSDPGIRVLNADARASGDRIFVYDLPSGKISGTQHALTPALATGEGQGLDLWFVLPSGARPSTMAVQLSEPDEGDGTAFVQTGQAPMQPAGSSGGAVAPTPAAVGVPSGGTAISGQGASGPFTAPSRIEIYDYRTGSWVPIGAASSPFRSQWVTGTSRYVDASGKVRVRLVGGDATVLDRGAYLVTGGGR